MCAVLEEVGRGTSEPLEVELQRIIGSMWVLEAEPVSVRATRALNY